ncbi:hypothetical protein N7457_001574 [Penicillium paradoxum]|uniref:uncharacterized protein n=1 Tax=Penicillium paradoxum TaxID=176176 RepID=UPI0025469C5D|nr:uncharacterized protein N7457_001574 [Penicillium paradoxum]KAJ5794975.1 hypothetical protein N7457_001574 [Penicillium paradoxum]
MQDIGLKALLVACITLFPSSATAFWRLPCRGRSGLARLDPIVEPGEISSHTHAVHGGGNFGMSADQDILRESECTSCAVTQDKSAYWHPALFFMHSNGSAEVVPEIGGMLVYYLLYGYGSGEDYADEDRITAFPDNFRMLAGDPFQRNFSLPVPDPPKSEWTGIHGTQEALRAKAVGFNCLNYNEKPEATLERHFLPNKTYLDAHCTDGVRFELMFPSCWNGKDLDSHDHKSHVQYPSLVMDGTCPEGYETRLVSLLFETIWDTYAFKDFDGYFTLANGDPTGYGYHGDFMQGWEEGVLQEAIETCTDLSGNVEDCPLFDIQSEDDQRKCEFHMPLALEKEDCSVHDEGLPGAMPVEWGPERAIMKAMSMATSAASLVLPTISIGDIAIDPNTLFHDSPATTSFNSTSTPSPTPTPVTSTIIDPFTEEIIYLERDIVIMCDGNGENTWTSTGPLRTVSSTTTTLSVETSTIVSYVTRDTIPEAEVPAPTAAHARRHAHHRHDHLHN